VAAAALALPILVAEAISLLTDLEISRSQAAVRSGHLSRARSDAVAATLIEPWAATPYLQLALVDEASGDLAAARSAIEDSIRRDAADWRPWYVAARIQTDLGEPAAATRSLARAKSLDPLSPLFSDGGSR
jgi:Tfp pilus assembly protein PilF